MDRDADHAVSSFSPGVTNPLRPVTPHDSHFNILVAIALIAIAIGSVAGTRTLKYSAVATGRIAGVTGVTSVVRITAGRSVGRSVGRIAGMTLVGGPRVQVVNVAIGRATGHAQISESRKVLIPLTTYGHIVRAQVKYWDDNVVPNSQKFFYAIISARSPVAAGRYNSLTGYRDSEPVDCGMKLGEATDRRGTNWVKFWNFQMLLLKMVLDEKAQYQNLSYALVMFELEASFTNDISGALYEANIVSVTL
ncbi:hypothetical protein EV424DRAFT_1352044 [Suillus variegatus]|nr:hypothetical protein EV424DRAFT_1352044 [Suillus variegatus]